MPPISYLLLLFLALFSLKFLSSLQLQTYHPPHYFLILISLYTSNDFHKIYIIHLYKTFRYYLPSITYTFNIPLLLYAPYVISEIFFVSPSTYHFCNIFLSINPLNYLSSLQLQTAILLLNPLLPAFINILYTLYYI